MVAMQMAEQNMTNLAHSDVVTSQTDLHSFATIDQEQVAPEVDDLGRRGMSECRLGTATAQNCYVEAIQFN